MRAGARDEWARAALAWMVAPWSAALVGCLDPPDATTWPDLSGFGTRVVALRDEDGAVRFLRAGGPDGLGLSFVSHSGSATLLLDYECAEPESLGFRAIGAEGLEGPAGPVRSPERLFALEDGTPPTFRVLEGAAARDALSGLGLDFRPPSLCRQFDMIVTPLAYEMNQRSRFLLELPDRSVLLMTVVDDEEVGSYSVYAYRFWSPDEFERYDLPASAPAAAAALDAAGQLWLFGRDGALAVGAPDDLGDFEARFRTLARGRRAHNCTRPEAGSHNDTQLDAFTVTGTVAQLLSVDGSGTLQLFRNGGWTTLHDPVTATDLTYLCNVTPTELAWVGLDEALLLNRSILDPSPQVLRVSFDAAGAATFSDDRVPDSVEGVERMLDLGPRGVYAGGSRGRLALRRDGRWTRIEPDIKLSRNVAILTLGPGGALIAGNGAEGLAQYWLDADGGPLACSSAAVTSRLRDAGRLGEEHILALPSNEGVDRYVTAFRFREPEICEPHPD